MAVLVDASLITVLASGDHRRVTAHALVAGWIQAGEQLHAELSTFDGPLARNAASLGFRVRLIE